MIPSFFKKLTKEQWEAARAAAKAKEPPTYEDDFERRLNAVAEALNFNEIEWKAFVPAHLEESRQKVAEAKSELLGVMPLPL